ncbi:hypothetical protein G6F70_003479 [Rhizopus microsporus]|nr:hypothetical protein G6F71_000057 [Rhizopus microsporus]KAG1201060.1 hypothetical protein G6F70_003479 [Rhizopus microsporus]KAG1213016.1 hypothetical protein G6F69_003206 [Rhizopus microsporus]
MNISEFTQEQIVELLELSRSLKLERDRRERDSYLLPDKILEDMEDTPKIELKDNIKKFQRRTVNYEGGNWTRSGRINKIFIANLKKFNLDAHTVVSYKYKDAERLRTAGKAAA